MLKRPFLIVLTVIAIVTMSAPMVSARQPVPQNGLAGSSFRYNPFAGLAPEEQVAAINTANSRVESWAAANVETRPWVDPIQQQQTTAQWTILVHVAGDNNLEGMALLDFNEMEISGSTQDVNVLVQLDRSADYEKADGDWSNTRRYYVQQDKDMNVINSTLVEEVGEVDTGSPESLVDFVTWGITNYPAQKYMLVLWDHGGAWISHSSDEDSGNEMDIPETIQALDQIRANTGIEQFEVLGFDMCLMAQLEIFQSIAPYARYSVASEEVEPGPGWFWAFIDELAKDPTQDGSQITPKVVDYYMQFLQEIWPYEEDAFGLGAIDLSKTPDLVNAVDAFTAAVQANPEAALSPIADARNNTIAYGGDADNPSYADYFSSVDLYMLQELLYGITNIPELQQAAQAVMDAIPPMVLYELHNKTLEGSRGVAIYFPRTIKAYTKYGLHERYPVETPADLAPWVEFLGAFHNTATTTVTEAPNLTITETYPDVVSIYQPAVVTLDVSGRDILEVNYAVTLITSETERVVLDYDYLISRTTTATGADIVNWSDGVTTRTFSWDAEVPVLTDGTVSTYGLLLPNSDSPDTALVNGEYTSVDGGDPVQAQMTFDLNTRQATALWGLNETASGTVQPFQIQIQTGDTFRPLWLTLDQNNELASTSFGETLTLSTDTPISFQKVPAPSGQYSISFVALNVAGDSTLAESLITVNNDNLDPALRGYTDLTYGVNFRYPATWIRPRFTPDGMRLFTADLASNTLLTLFPYTDVTSAEETATAVKNSWSELENLQIQNERPVDINGLAAYVIDYTYTFEGQPRTGAVIAIFVPDQNVGYGFDLDAPSDNPGPAQEALAVLVESINFFPPTTDVAESDWQTATLPNANASFPVPSDWVAAQSGEWTLYGPAEDASIFVGALSAPSTGQSMQELAQFWTDQLQAGVTNLQVSASQEYYVGNQNWYLVVFTYDGEAQKMAGAFFATTVGGQDYVFWMEAPDAQFDQLYADVFSVSIGGFVFGG